MIVRAGVATQPHDRARGEAAAAEIGDGATALQLDLTDTISIDAAAERIREEVGRLDLLVNNAAISTPAPTSTWPDSEPWRRRAPPRSTICGRPGR